MGEPFRLEVHLRGCVEMLFKKTVESARADEILVLEIVERFYSLEILVDIVEDAV